MNTVQKDIQPFANTQTLANPPAFTNSSTHRIVYFDYLRVFATFAVMILHISAQKWYITDVNSFAWKTFNFFNSMVRWGVPVFVMISGALFLDRKFSIQKIFSKYIVRLLVAFLVWSAIYASFTEGDILMRTGLLIQGHYHMWFIPMIAGLYLCIPFIQAIINNEKRLQYYLILAFLFAFVKPEMLNLAGDFACTFLLRGVQTIHKQANNMNMHLVLGYASYFVLGYYLNKIDLRKLKRIVIYLLGVLGFAATILLDLTVALKTQQCCGTYYNYFTVNVLLESIAVFTWFKYRTYRIKRQPIMVQLSKLSFGAYLVHTLIIEQLDRQLGLNTLSFNAILSVTSIGIIVFVASFSISLLLSHIPIAKNYMI